MALPGGEFISFQDANGYREVYTSTGVQNLQRAYYTPTGSWPIYSRINPLVNSTSISIDFIFEEVEADGSLVVDGGGTTQTMAPGASLLIEWTMTPIWIDVEGVPTPFPRAPDNWYKVTWSPTP